jgi:ring-1,2-phenylacetyl-CoA epoxidase subunit PaaD
MVAARPIDAKATKARAWAVASAVPDPEIPCVTVADLGILRSVEMVDGIAVAQVTPTYVGYPAVLAIELAVETALLDAGIPARVQRTISPAWSTDWITDQGRQKLKDYGIAPPLRGQPAGKRALFDEDIIQCPLCNSTDTKKISEFGSTACKAHYQCNQCAEPFDYFKCI